MRRRWWSKAKGIMDEAVSTERSGSLVLSEEVPWQSKLANARSAKLMSVPRLGCRDAAIEIGANDHNTAQPP
jgi:hypothetical protein